MKTFHGIVVALVIIGAFNWGLIGLFDFNLVSAIFGTDTFWSNVIYVLVGAAAVVAIFTEFAVHRATHTRSRPEPRVTTTTGRREHHPART